MFLLFQKMVKVLILYIKINSVVKKLKLPTMTEFFFSNFTVDRTSDKKSLKSVIKIFYLTKKAFLFTKHSTPV